MARRVGIIQSSYIPWKGYFDFIDSVDEFVLLDEVQYVRRDWRNRNRIKTKDGLQWLTIAVEAKGHYDSAIDEIRIADPTWVDHHLRSLKHVYGRAPHFEDTWDWLAQTYDDTRHLERLSQVNESLLRAICTRLGITTPIRRSRDFAAPQGKNERLLTICRQLQATEYVSGPAARHYIDELAWNGAGIEVRYKSYDGYPEYTQLHPPFEHGVTILDVLFHCGAKARDYLKSARDVE